MRVVAWAWVLRQFTAKMSMEWNKELGSFPLDPSFSFPYNHQPERGLSSRSFIAASTQSLSLDRIINPHP
jgi:hypothetical protein